MALAAALLGASLLGIAPETPASPEPSPSSQATPSPDTAVVRQARAGDVSGYWRFDPEKSDDARQKMREAMQGRERGRGRGGFQGGEGGRGGGGFGGQRGGPG